MRAGATTEELAELDSLWGELSTEEQEAERARVESISDAMLAENLDTLFPSRIAPAPSGTPANALDDHAAGILSDFRSRAKEIVQAAEAEAEKLLALVDREVPAAVAAAEAEVRRLKTEAAAEAERLLAEAEAAVAKYLASHATVSPGAAGGSAGA
jgi:hypothetical protein